VLLGCKETSAQYAKLIEPQEMSNIITSKEVILLDVRTPQEFNQGHIDGAINIDFMARDFNEQLKQLNTDKPVVVYCRSGRRSGLSSKNLTNIGFKEIYDLKGGTISWQRQGFKLVK
jgi:rhodanese-related sulfurtransferase